MICIIVCFNPILDVISHRSLSSPSISSLSRSLHRSPWEESEVWKWPDTCCRRIHRWEVCGHHVPLPAVCLLQTWVVFVFWLEQKFCKLCFVFVCLYFTKNPQSLDEVLMFLFAVTDLKNAVPCAVSYLLFDPSDEVMKNNVAYYKFHKNQWGLTEEDFLPRSVRHVNDYAPLYTQTESQTLHVWWMEMLY